MKKMLSMLHYNERKQAYKTLECFLDKDMLMISLREGVKGQKEGRQKVAFSLSIAEALELAKILEIMVEEAIKERSKKLE